MELTLRKANALVKQTFQAQQAIAIRHTAVLSIYSDVEPEQTISEAHKKFHQALNDALVLSEIAFKIRALMKAENSRAGIDALLNEKAGIEAKESLIQRYLKVGVLPEISDDDDGSPSSVPILKERLRAMKARAEATTATRYTGVDEHITVPVLRDSDNEVLREQLANLRERKAKIADELMERNWHAKVNVPDEIIRVLKDHKIRIG